MMRTGLMNGVPGANELANTVVGEIRECVGGLLASFKTIYAGEHVDEMFAVASVLHAILGKDREADEIFDFVVHIYRGGGTATAGEAAPAASSLVSIRDDVTTRARKESWTRNDEAPAGPAEDSS